MSFLHPEFLWALSLASLPVIIHLLNIRKYRTVYFSNTHLLETVEKQNKRRSTITELIILLLRVLTIAAIVLAFAQPVSNQGTKVVCNQKAVFYIDNSFSMSLNSEKGTNLETAKKAAFEIMKSFSPQSRFIILTNNSSADELSYYQRQDAINKLAQISYSPQHSTLNNIWLKINKIISKDTTCKIPVFIISDFQKTNFAESIKLPDYAKVYLIQTKANVTGNISVDTARFFSPNHLQGSKDSIELTITNRWKEVSKDIKVSIEIDDTLQATTTVDLHGYESKKIRLSFFNGHGKWHKGKIYINDSPVLFDDTLFFAYKTRDKFNVLIINGTQPSKYLTAFYSGDFFNLHNTQETEIPYNDLTKYDCIILNQPNVANDGLSSALQKFTEQGGNLIFIPALQTDPQVLNTYTSALKAGEFGKIVEKKQEITSVDLLQNIFASAVEKTKKQNIRYPYATKHRLKQINLATESSIATFKDQTPAITISKNMAGEIYFLTFPLKDSITNFMYDPLFVPFFFNIPATAGKILPLYFIYGQYATIPKEQNDENIIKLISPAGIETYPPVTSKNQELLVELTELDEKAGIYKAVSNEQSLGWLAINYDRKESQMDFLTQKELEKKVKNATVLQLNKTPNIASAVQSKNDSNFVWKFFLILALVFLFLEMLIIRLTT